VTLSCDRVVETALSHFREIAKLEDRRRTNVKMVVEGIQMPPSWNQQSQSLSELRSCDFRTLNSEFGDVDTVVLSEAVLRMNRYTAMMDVILGKTMGKAVVHWDRGRLSMMQRKQSKMHVLIEELLRQVGRRR